MDTATTAIDPGFVDRVRAYAATKGRPGTVIDTAVDGLSVVTADATTPLTAAMYDPVVCLILQGAKAVELGTERVRCAAGHSVIVSHDVPLQSQITDAPYLALVLTIDLALLRELADTPDDARDVASLALQVGHSDDATIAALRRLFALMEHPDEAAVLAPLIRRELHFRLLQARHGAMLRQLLRRESRACRVAEAIARIRNDITRTVAVPDLADTVGMSQSSFHEHFKAVTGTTPLQYQKDLRLLEARRLLRDETRSVTYTALAVGYRSPTQFTREYTRRYGTPPRDDRTRPHTTAV